MEAIYVRRVVCDDKNPAKDEALVVVAVIIVHYYSFTKLIIVWAFAAADN